MRVRAVQPVGEVDRVGGADQYQHDPGKVEPTEVGDPFLEERKAQMEVEFSVMPEMDQDQPHCSGDEDLEEELVADDQSPRLVFFDLQVVVPEP